MKNKPTKDELIGLTILGVPLIVLYVTDLVRMVFR